MFRSILELAIVNGGKKCYVYILAAIAALYVDISVVSQLVCDQ